MVVGVACSAAKKQRLVAKEEIKINDDELPGLTGEIKKYRTSDVWLFAMRGKRKISSFEAQNGTPIFLKKVRLPNREEPVFYAQKGEKYYSVQKNEVRGPDQLYLKLILTEAPTLKIVLGEQDIELREAPENVARDNRIYQGYVTEAAHRDRSVVDPIIGGTVDKNDRYVLYDVSGVEIRQGEGDGPRIFSRDAAIDALINGKDPFSNQTLHMENPVKKIESKP